MCRNRNWATGSAEAAPRMWRGCTNVPNEPRWECYTGSLLSLPGNLPCLSWNCFMGNNSEFSAPALWVFCLLDVKGVWMGHRVSKLWPPKRGGGSTGLAPTQLKCNEKLFGQLCSAQGSCPAPSSHPGRDISQALGRDPGCLFSRKKKTEICEVQREKRDPCNARILFCVPATAAGLCGLGELAAEEEASSEACAGPEAGSAGWGHPGPAHRDCGSVLPSGPVFPPAGLALAWRGCPGSGIWQADVPGGSWRGKQPESR